MSKYYGKILLIIIFSIMIYIILYNNIERYKVQTFSCDISNLCFILVRHVVSEETNNYWKESYKCIRKYYPKNKIIIIDDNSPYLEIGKIPDDVILINSEYPKRGELLLYYYFHKYKFAKNAVLLHDSVFLHSKIDLSKMVNFQPLWTFDPYKYDFVDHYNDLIFIFNKLNKMHILREAYNKNNNFNWKGCFGGMSVINWNFLDKIETKYNLFNNLLEHINSRKYRMLLERIFPIFFTLELGQQPSIYGDIFSYGWGLTFNDYLQKMPRKIEKVWTGR